MATTLLFVSVPLSGHLNPALSVAEATAARAAAAAAAGGGASKPDHDAPAAPAAPPAVARVRFAGLSCSRAVVEAAGIEFVDLGVPSAADAAELEAFSAASLAPARARGLEASARLFSAYGRVMFAPLMAALTEGAAAGTGAIVCDFATLVRVLAVLAGGRGSR